MNTKENILDKALELFNQRGIEVVGIREIAGELAIRPGNITYYFPKKEDILVELGKQLTALNSATIIPQDNYSMKDFMERYYQVFINHYQYRCLFISIVSQMQQNKILSENYSKVEKNRQEELTNMLLGLSKKGYLEKNISEEDVKNIVAFLSIVARFWISEAAISYKKLSKKQTMHHYLNLIGFVLSKHATAKGKKEIDVFFNSF